MSDSRLVDPFGRRITYLRLSVTDRCDFRCTYCMSEDMQFLPRDQVLSLEELYAVADAFIGLGVRRIRITGGEPLVRKGITGLLARLGQRAELEDLAITTNGSQLRERAAELKAAGVRRLNVSLDSLQRERFAAFTRSDRLEQVLDGIQAAREAGFERIKLNCVVQKGRNDDEILDLVEYALANQLDISFIEEMPLGSITSHRRELTLCTSDEVRAIIERRWPLTPSLSAAAGRRGITRSATSPAGSASSHLTAIISAATATACASPPRASWCSASATRGRSTCANCCAAIPATASA